MAFMVKTEAKKKNSSLIRLDMQRTKGKKAIHINDLGKDSEQFDVNHLIFKTNGISRQHPLIFSNTATHMLPMLDVCGRTEQRTAHKCISKHQYHISCGLYFQAKVQG